MNITSIVIIYNSKIQDSETLQSIIECHIENINLEICIWNNGPQLLNENDIANFLSICLEKNIKVNIYQDTRNISLSKIYNFFIKNTSYDFITILDQDSVLPPNYYHNISHHGSMDIIVPKVIADKNGMSAQTDPHIYGDSNIMIDDGPVNVKIDSIMSGLTLSQNAIGKIVAFRGYVFEEKLAFYGIDSDLFRIISMMSDTRRPLNIYCTNEIHHSFAIFNQQEAKSKFRMMEMFYFKFFIRNEYQKKAKISTIWVCLRDFIRGKSSFYRTKNLIKFTLINIHPRSKLEIDDKITPTHYI
ncbi:MULTISPECIES: glycosyltransferase family 2 protein [unclassified Brenneria]|uniref:glycosyltransferase family 2 protein n=1 Tax=unclassified Brenneria TaxID=2634434 RepID=UPI0018F0666D|nr:glycosyltransferase family A protein [Brenneria sp. L3-3C-1]MBJ7223402.1 glycosyltransferase family 2 protein [Brenneria sp. L3-3C-1]MEE3644642.1 glycosyltransferase family A protein [Brenneria sp. L3_3C_1]